MSFMLQLIDEIECPDPVKAYLLEFGGLSTNMYWSTNALTSNNSANNSNSTLASATEKNIKEHQLEVLCPETKSFVRLFVHNVLPGKKFEIFDLSINRSKYERSKVYYKSQRFHNLTPMGIVSHNASNGNDDGLDGKQDLENEIKDVASQIKQLDYSHGQKMKQQQENSRLIEAATTKIGSLQKLKKEPDNIKAKMKSIERRVGDLKQQLNSSHGENERVAKLREYEKTVMGLLKAIKASVALCKTSTSYLVQKVTCDKAVAMHKRALNVIRTELEDSRESLGALKDAVEVAKRERSLAHQKFEECNEQIMAMKDKVGEVGYEAIIAKVIEQCGPLVAPQTTDPGQDDTNSSSTSSSSSSDSLVPSLTGLNVLGRRIPHVYSVEEIERTVQARYQQVKTELHQRLIELERVSADANNAIGSLDKRVEEWETQVAQVVQKLNVLFSAFMSELMYQGEVFDDMQLFTSVHGYMLCTYYTVLLYQRLYTARGEILMNMRL